MGSGLCRELSTPVASTTNNLSTMSNGYISESRRRSTGHRVMKAVAVRLVEEQIY